MYNTWRDAKDNPPTVQNEYLITWTAAWRNEGRTNPLLDICEYSTEEGWITDEIEKRGYRDVEVIGWMPCPKPYNGKEHMCKTCVRSVVFAGVCDSCIHNKTDHWMDTETASLSLIDAYYKARKHSQSIGIIEFQCPICLGTAKGATEESMGHIRIECGRCGTRIIS